MRERRCAGVPLRDDTALMQQRQAIAAVRFIQNVRGQQDGHTLLAAQLLDVLPQLAARAGVQARRSFIHQQDDRPMQQTFGDLDAALQASGKLLHNVIAPVREAETRHDLLHAIAQLGAGEAVQMTLAAQVLSNGQSLIQALRLEHDSDAAPYRCRLPRHVVPGHFGAPFGRHHHRGENAE